MKNKKLWIAFALILVVVVAWVFRPLTNQERFELALYHAKEASFYISEGDRAKSISEKERYYGKAEKHLQKAWYQIDKILEDPAIRKEYEAKMKEKDAGSLIKELGKSI